MEAREGEEYRAVREGAGVVRRDDQAQLRLWGRDPVKMLHGLITNDLLAAATGQGVYAVMLTPKGRVITELRAFALERQSGRELLVDVPRETLDATVEHLRKFVPPMFARWQVLEGVGALGVYGPHAHRLLSAIVGAELPELEEDRFVEIPFAGAPLLIVGTGYAGGEAGFDLFGPDEALEAVRGALLSPTSGEPAREVGLETVDTLRIEAGRPRGGHELTEESIPTEAFESTGMMERAISFSKGCYTGQEVIVRIAHRGHVNRHLRGLRVGDAPAPAPGTPLLLPDGKQVGRVTSTALSSLLGERVALDYGRREVSPGERVRLGAADGSEGVVTALPFTRGG